MSAHAAGRHAIKLIYVLMFGAVVTGSLGAYEIAALLVAAVALTVVGASQLLRRQ